MVPLGSFPSSVELAGVPVLSQVAGIGSTNQRTLGVSLDTSYGINNPYAWDGFVIVSIG